MDSDQTGAQNDRTLQGLRQAPLALFILGVMLSRLGQPGLSRSPNLTVTIPLLGAAILLWFGIGKYYENRFGFAEPRAEKARKAITGLLLVLFYAAFYLIETNAAGGGARPYPISLSGIFVGVLFVGMGRSANRPDYLGFGLLLIGESILPLFLRRPLTDPLFGALGLLYGLTFSIGLLAISVVDHIRLMRSVHPG
jgi:hypothetical protein